MIRSLRTPVLAAGLIAAALIAGSLFFRSTDKSASSPVHAQPTMVDGIPQQGMVLGRPDAPVTLVEYADLQCPYCAQWEQQTLPALVSRYVLSGKVRIEFRGLAFLGPDSERGLRAVLAAGRQGRGWQMLTGLYARQGVENSGWLTDDMLRTVARSGGVDAARMFRDMPSAGITAEMSTLATQATRDGIHGTPSLLVGQTGGHLQQITLTTLAPSGTLPAVQRLLDAR
jgi:protein-disulfide isomerase